VLEDEPLHLRSGGKDWSPQNYDGEFRGKVTARQALEQSLNVPTVRAAQQVGIRDVIETARRCGIESRMTEVPSLALGTAEVTPLEMATAYAVFAQQGIRVSPWIIRAVIDRHGQRLEGRALERSRAVSPQTAFQVDDLLRGVFVRGTARSAAALGFRGSAAGKTGTTDGTRDAWFVGYTGDLLALVWVGHDDNRTTGLTGATGALPIWVDFAAPDAAVERRRQPSGMVRHLVCAETGRLARERCPVIVEEWFTPGSEPRDRCPRHLGRFKRWWRKTFGRED
jgi:penicillin-binding protein 1B